MITIWSTPRNKLQPRSRRNNRSRPVMVNKPPEAEKRNRMPPSESICNISWSSEKHTKRPMQTVEDL